MTIKDVPEIVEDEALSELVVPEHVLAALQAEIRPTRRPGEFSEKEFNVWFAQQAGEPVSKDRSKRVLEELRASGLAHKREGIVNRTQGFWWRWEGEPPKIKKPTPPTKEKRRH